MNIKKAKEDIKNTVRAYLDKDEFGQYRIPEVRQRPILLMGPPGIGMTQNMQQIAREVCRRDEHTVQEVLVEEINEHDPSLVSGRLSNNTLVHFPGDASMIGTLQKVYLEESKGFYYMGSLVTEEK